MRGDESEARDRYDTLYEKIVMPAATAAGMEALNALADCPGNITTEIFKKIRHAHVVVADITGDNTCVGYELAYAHSLARCTVLLIKGNKSPFDLKDMNRIKCDHDDPASIRTAKEELINQLGECRKVGWISANNPIFQAAYPLPAAEAINHYQNALSALANLAGPPPK
jgi:hypothetical protein